MSQMMNDQYEVVRGRNPMEHEVVVEIAVVEEARHIVESSYSQ